MRFSQTLEVHCEKLEMNKHIRVILERRIDVVLIWMAKCMFLLF